MIKRIVLTVFIIIFSFSCYIYFKQKPQPQEKKQLVFWSIQLKPIYEEELNNIIAEFEKKHADVKINWVDIPLQEAEKRTLAAILSSTPPDLINSNSEFSSLLAQKNALDFFNKNEVTQFHPNLIEKSKLNDKIFAFPFYSTSSITIYNKKNYNKCLGNSFVKTFDELTLISPKLKSCSQHSTLTIALNEGNTLSKILNKYNINSQNLDEQEAIKIYTMFDKMYKNKELPEDVLTINHLEVAEKYMSGQTDIIITGSNFINKIKQGAPDIYKNSDIAPQITGKNGKYDISLMNLIIPKKAKNKELAKEFAYLLTSKENQLKLAKLTNVLPANKYALEDTYFKNCSSDLIDSARCISAKQLDNLSIKDFGSENKKTKNEAINKALEEILLNKNSCPESIKARIHNLFLHLNNLK